MRNYLQKHNDNVTNLFDAFDDFFFRPVFANENDYLKSDIRETEKEYHIDMAVPGFKKEQIHISLENGYLNVVCSKNERDENNTEGATYRRKEISEYSSRSFYVGDDITQEDIKAKYENGILSLNIPKAQPKIAEKSYITIE